MSKIRYQHAQMLGETPTINCDGGVHGQRSDEVFLDAQLIHMLNEPGSLLRAVDDTIVPCLR